MDWVLLTAIVTLGCVQCVPSKQDVDGASRVSTESWLSAPKCLPSPDLQPASSCEDPNSGDWAVTCEIAPSRAPSRRAELTESAHASWLRTANGDSYVAAAEYASSVDSLIRGSRAWTWPSNDPALPDLDGTRWTLWLRHGSNVRTYERQAGAERALLDICALLGLLDEARSLSLDSGRITVYSEDHSAPGEWPQVVTLRLGCEDVAPDSEVCAARVKQLLRTTSCSPWNADSCSPVHYALITTVGSERPVPTLCTWYGTLTAQGWRLAGTEALVPSTDPR